MLPTVSGLSRRTQVVLNRTRVLPMSSFQVEMTLEGYRLPKSTSVIYWAVSNLTSEAHFPNPEQFLPDRWLRDCSRSSKAAHSHVRLPFGHGPRMCVGRR